MRYIWLFACLLLVGCGRKDALTPDSSAATGKGETAPARRIVTLTPGLTEFIYAVGAEASLIATVEYADYPQAAKQIPRLGDAFRVDMERLLALKPDMVLAWTSGTPATTVAQLRALGLRVETLEVSRLGDVPATLRHIGQLAGHAPRAEQAALAFERGIANLRARYATRSRLSIFVQVNRQPLYTVNGRHVLSEVLQLCGGENVFADLSPLAPIVGVESVLAKNPQVILSTEGSLDEVRRDWRVWPQIAAVRDAHLFVVSPDTTTRATPRLLLGAAEVCAAIDSARL